MNDELLYLIALSNIQGLGPVKAKTLLKHVGSAREIFRQKKNTLCKIPEIGVVTSSSIASAEFRRAEKEIEFILKEGIHTAVWSTDSYPERLIHCDDSPIILYSRGCFDWNPKRAISIVGTRKADAYGKQFCRELITSLKAYSPSIVSGLAHGIDGSAHTAAVENDLPTIACVAHGLERIYPPAHSTLAGRMMRNGGIVSEFLSNTPMAPEMFPMRNRLIAGMSDCTIVVQTDMKGGSMITANLAHSYSREVFAVPGRYNDLLSKGCHRLIKNNVAAILTGAEDLVQYMQWDETTAKQTRLAFDEHPNEHARLVLVALQKQSTMQFDELLSTTTLGWGLLNSVLLELEFEGRIQLLPGKFYRLLN
jgi:DNA processing protein